MPIDASLLQESAAEQQTPDEAGLTAVSDLVRQQLEAEDLVAELTKTLGAATQRLKRLSEIDLPAAMQEHNLRSLTTGDGSAVTITPIVRASISKAQQGTAFAWLEENGYGDLIKNVVKATFGRGEDSEAIAAMAALSAQGCEPEQTRSVHPGTLSAQVRSWIQDGTPFPVEALGVFQGEKAKITRAK